jgi:hypothetical protein
MVHEIYSVKEFLRAFKCFSLHSHRGGEKKSQG